MAEKEWAAMMSESEETHGQPKRPAITIYRFAAGAVAAFDSAGEQVPQVQGPLTELACAGLPSKECVGEMTRRGWIAAKADVHVQ